MVKHINTEVQGCSPLNVGDGNILQILKRRWWKYLLLGLVDVEANYTVVKAYQYTTLTSVQVRTGCLCMGFWEFSHVSRVK